MLQCLKLCLRSVFRSDGVVLNEAQGQPSLFQFLYFVCMGWAKFACLLSCDVQDLLCLSCTATCCKEICELVFIGPFRTRITSCCLVVRVPGYRSRGPGFDSRSYQIFWEVVWNGVHSASWAQLKSYLKEKAAAPVQKSEITVVGDLPHWLRDTPLSARVDTRSV
jgi:hypothetical protein